MTGVDPLPDRAPSLRVAILAAYATARAGLRAVVQEDPGLVVLADQPGDEGDEADVLVVDLEGFDGIEALQELEARPAVFLWAAPVNDLDFEPARAHLLRDATAEEIHAAIHAVAQGLTVFDPTFLTIIREREPRPSVASGEGLERLTDREYEVLRLLADGLTNKAIAHRLGISDHTAKFHVGAILSKLDAESRTEAVTIAARSGLLPL